MTELPADPATLMRIGATVCGAAAALLLLSLAVWTARDVSARTGDRLVRLAAVALVLVLNVFGLVIYLLLRPRETASERYERELIEEILAREISAGAIKRRQ
jgi:uncharacterized membrane protein YadS